MSSDRNKWLNNIHCFLYIHLHICTEMCTSVQLWCTCSSSHMMSCTVLLQCWYSAAWVGGMSSKYFKLWVNIDCRASFTIVQVNLLTYCTSAMWTVPNVACVLIPRFQLDLPWEWSWLVSRRGTSAKRSMQFSSRFLRCLTWHRNQWMHEKIQEPRIFLVQVD